jgi:diadenylate cyclase
VAEKRDTSEPAQVLRNALIEVAPGTALRDGLERILRGRTGGLIVLGYDKIMEQASGGGFVLDVEFSATRLRELSKMDGAIIIEPETNRIVRAAVQLLPDPTIPTEETGTRHRTADRIAKQTGHPVISVSKSMNIIALYVGTRRYVLEDTAAILSRANQGIATLERYRHRLDQVSSNLSALEVEDLVTVRDVAAYTQRLEMVRRIHHEIESYVIELGTDGRLIALQVEELIAGIQSARELLVRDYMIFEKGRRPKQEAQVLDALGSLTSEELLDLLVVAKAFNIATTADALDNPISARGYRLLARIPRLPEVIVERLVAHFSTLQPLLVATTEDLQKVEGVGEARARSIRDGLSRLSEATILERYL